VEGGRHTEGEHRGLKGGFLEPSISNELSFHLSFSQWHTSSCSSPCVQAKEAIHAPSLKGSELSKKDCLCRSRL
jgi:hypothetical protein